MSRELIPPGPGKAARREAVLCAAAQRQLIGEEHVELGLVLGDQHVAVTDRRLVITKVGSMLGERAESIPLAAISSIATTVDDGRIVAVQLSVPGRTWGELAITGEDLGPVHAALIRCLPVMRSLP